MSGAVVIDILGGLAMFALVASLIQTLPRRTIVRSRRVVPISAAFAALAAALVAGSLVDAPLTGSHVWDTLLVAAVVGLAAVGGAVASSRLLVVVALVPTLAPGTSTSHTIGAVALGSAFAAAAVGMRLPPIKAVVGGLVGFGLVALVAQGPAGALSCLAGLCVLLVVVAGRASHAARREILVATAALALLIGLAGASYARIALATRHTLDQAVTDARLALDAATGPSPAQSLAGFQRAGAEFAAASDRLDSTWARPVTLIPGASQNARALSTAAKVGRALAAAGSDAVAARTAAHLRVSGSAVNVAALESLAAPAARAQASLRSAQTRLAAVRSPLLVPIVQQNLRTLSDRIERADHQATTLEQALVVLPDLMGSRRPRRYFLAIQNPAEARATGGIIGNFAVVTVSDGRIELTTQGRDDQLNSAGTPQARTLTGPADYLARYAQFEPAQTWQNVTLSPDFPSVGQVIEQLYPQSGGVPVDGVISVDPAALAGVLTLIGPVTVPLWPVPLSGINVTPILLHDQYLLPQDQRLHFMSDVVQAVFDRLKLVDLTDPKAISSVFSALFADKHVLLYSASAAEEREFALIGAAGAMPPVSGDFLAAVTQNASGNKIDWYLHRTVRDEVSFDPPSGTVRARVTLTLQNTAPTSGVPDYVIGGVGTQPTRPGESRVWVSLYTPLQPDGATFDGEPLAIDTQSEVQRNVASAFVVLPGSSTSTIVFTLSGRLPSSRRYSLTMRSQPTVFPDQATVRVALPPGWVPRGDEAAHVGGNTATWSGAWSTDKTFALVGLR